MAKATSNTPLNAKDTALHARLAAVGPDLTVLLVATTEKDIAAAQNYAAELFRLIPTIEIVYVGTGLGAESLVSAPDILTGLSMSSRKCVLIVEDFGVGIQQLGDWLERNDGELPSEAIWVASGGQAGFGGKLRDTFLDLFVGVRPSTAALGFRLYPTDVAKLLFARSGGNGVTELLYQASLYQVEVVQMPILEPIVGENTGAGETSGSTLGAWARSWVAWGMHYFYHPFTDSKYSFVAQKESSLFRFLFAVTSLLLFVCMPYWSFDYGMTADEYVQNEYGNLLLKYYESGGKDARALFYRDLYNYGGLFDYWAAWCNKHLGWFDDPYEMRHLLNALVGAFLMLFVGMVAQAVSGSWLAAWLAVLFAALSPRLFGDCMNNPKDIPFAAAYVFTVYHLIRFARQLPRPRVRTCVLVVVGIAAAINIRIGGLLLIPYLGAFSGIAFLWKPSLRQRLLDIPLMTKMFGLGAVIAAAGLWCGTWYWPYGALDWTKNPFVVLERMSHYYVGIRILFDSQSIWSDTVPWNYVPNWLLFTTPLFVLVGLLGAPIMAYVRRAEGRSLPLVLVTFAALFPILYVIYQQSGLYDGIRHMLFAYSLLVVLAAWGWSALIRLFNVVWAKWLVALPLLALWLLPATFMVRNHPYQYTYFNELIGGTQGAFGKYESDYWMVSVKPLSKWFDENIASNNRKDTLVVATNCNYTVSHYLRNKNVKVVYVRYHDREKAAWDYGIFYSRFIDREFLVNQTWPPEQVLHTETVDGSPLGVVVKRKSRTDAAAVMAFNQQDYARSVELFEQIIRENPKNESAMLLLSQVYSQTKQWPEMKAVLDKALLLSDKYSHTWGMMGIYYLGINNPKEAKLAFLNAVEADYKYTVGHYHLARIYAQENQPDEALACLEFFDAHGGQPAQGYDLAVQVAQNSRRMVQLYYFTSKKLEKSQQWVESMKMLQKALDIDPTYEPALKAKREYDEAAEKQMLKLKLAQ